MKNKLNHNEATVVEDYHKRWNDKVIRPTMIEVHLSVMEEKNGKKIWCFLMK